MSFLFSPVQFSRCDLGLTSALLSFGYGPAGSASRLSSRPSRASPSLEIRPRPQVSFVSGFPYEVSVYRSFKTIQRSIKNFFSQFVLVCDQDLRFDFSQLLTLATFVAPFFLYRLISHSVLDLGI